MNPLTPKGFLTIGGVVLLLVGILGFIGVIGPTPDKSLFGSFWWFDTPENVAHTILGIVALLATVALKDANLQKWLVAAVGALAILVALYNLMGNNAMLIGANLESPADLLLHTLVGVWGLVAAFKPMGGTTSTPPAAKTT